MPKISSSLPRKSKEFENQLDLSPITDDEFEALSRRYRPPLPVVLYQCICFVVFLGPLRALFAVCVLLVTFCLIALIRVPMRLFGLGSAPSAACVSIARAGVRCLLFLFGVVVVQRRGVFEPTARFIVANHVSPLDALLIFALRDCTAPVDKSYRELRGLDLLLEAFGPIYFDARRPREPRLSIYRWADHFRRPPVLVFPEGFLSRGCGEILLKFGKTAFSTSYRVQPIALRYHMLGVPPGWNTYAYRGEGWLSLLWRFFSMPPSPVSVEILPTVSMDHSKSDIDRFLIGAQLSLANALGIRAVDRAEPAYAEERSDPGR
jgi:1-acyl-sn-glycerol-3-phosphate acyltransferase